MLQQVNVSTNFILQVDAKHSTQYLKKLISSSLNKTFAKNNLVDVSFIFQEEAEIYKNK